MDQADPRPIAYPLPGAALLPTWRSRRSQCLVALNRLVYRHAKGGVEDHGIKGLARTLEYGPVPLAEIGWLMRFPYPVGCLQRLSGLTIMIWRRGAAVRSVG